MTLEHDTILCGAPAASSWETPPRSSLEPIADGSRRALRSPSSSEEAAAPCGVCDAPLPIDARFCGHCGGEVLADPGDPRIGAMLLGRYRVLEEIGAGGMGVVYRAEQRVSGLRRTVAIKVLHPHLSAEPALRARFLRECDVVAQLSHPNTIRFFDFGELADGALAIVMEHVPGVSLADRLDEEGALPVTEALSVLGQICGALAEAHDHEIVHRDVKPDNVLVFERPEGGLGVKVLDFGVARWEASASATPLTIRGQLLGTPPYMSPEQLSGGVVDARSDVYALGVLAYELLTGEYPFRPASSVLEWMERHLEEAPTPIDQHAVAVALPAELRATLDACLAKDADDRPSSARELGRVIDAAQRVRADVARVDGPREKRATLPTLAMTPDPSSPFVDDTPVVPRTRRPWLLGLFAALLLAAFFSAATTLATEVAELEPSESIAVPREPIVEVKQTRLAECASAAAPSLCVEL